MSGYGSGKQYAPCGKCGYNPCKCHSAYSTGYNSGYQSQGYGQDCKSYYRKCNSCGYDPCRCNKHDYYYDDYNRCDKKDQHKRYARKCRSCDKHYGDCLCGKQDYSYQDYGYDGGYGKQSSKCRSCDKHYDDCRCDRKSRKCRSCDKHYDDCRCDRKSRKCRSCDKHYDDCRCDRKDRKCRSCDKHYDDCRCDRKDRYYDDDHYDDYDRCDSCDDGYDDHGGDRGHKRDSCRHHDGRDKRHGCKEKCCGLPQSRCHRRTPCKGKGCEYFESIKTCEISYKPREFIAWPQKHCAKLPRGCKTLNEIACIINKLGKGKGGFLVKLNPGEHRLDVNIGNLDQVEFRGDTTRVVGVAYLEQANYLPVLAINVAGKLGKYAQKKTGTGPFTLKVCGKKITVKTTSDDGFPPDFSCLTKGHRVRIVDRKGNTKEIDVECANCNTIHLACEPGIGGKDGKPCKGEGFCILPNVSIKTCDPQTVYAKCNIYTGINFETAALFRTGMISGWLALRHCVISGIFNVDGMMETDLPNANFGTMTWIAASMGKVIFFATLGKNGFLHIESNGYPFIIGSIWSGCELGLKLTIGGKLCTAFSQWFNCKRCSILDQSSNQNVQGNVYCNCCVCIDVGYNSGIGSEMLPFFPPNFKWEPTFENCKVAMSFYTNCVGRLPNQSDSDFVNVDTALIIDDVEFSAYSDYPNDQLGPRNSVVSNALVTGNVDVQCKPRHCKGKKRH